VEAAGFLQAAFLGGGGFVGPFLLSLTHFILSSILAYYLFFSAWSQDSVVLNGEESCVPGIELCAMYRRLCLAQSSVHCTELLSSMFSYIIPMCVVLSTVGNISFYISPSLLA
jgi:hypothetical protein